jgi:hypothetical protein
MPAGRAKKDIGPTKEKHRPRVEQRRKKVTRVFSLNEALLDVIPCLALLSPQPESLLADVVRHCLRALQTELLGTIKERCRITATADMIPLQREAASACAQQLIQQLLYSDPSQSSSPPERGSAVLARICEAAEAIMTQGDLVRWQCRELCCDGTHACGASLCVSDTQRRPTKQLLLTLLRGPHTLPLLKSYELPKPNEEVSLGLSYCAVESELKADAVLWKSLSKQLIANGMFGYFRSQDAEKTRDLAHRVFLLPRTSATLMSAVDIANFFATAAVPPTALQQELISIALPQAANECHWSSHRDETIPGKGFRDSFLVSVKSLSSRDDDDSFRFLKCSSFGGVTTEDLLLRMARICGLPRDAVLEAAYHSHEGALPDSPAATEELLFQADVAIHEMLDAKFHEQVRNVLRFVRLRSSTASVQVSALRKHFRSNATIVCPPRDAEVNAFVQDADTQRVRSVGRLSPRALFILLYRTATKDPFEQNLLRALRPPLPADTIGKGELFQWYWDDEIERLLGLLMRSLPSECVPHVAARARLRDWGSLHENNLHASGGRLRRAELVAAVKAIVDMFD